ncbi:MAG: NAD(P)-binding protein [Clostridium sp.]|nr:MAG: NAD(P)-binding protein [Clostridium sp.]
MDKNCRIAIIGAGPAGITAAYYLEKNGFTNYEILEREDHVGGKCFSPYYKGKRYDMGAILGAPSYDVVQEMMKDCGIQIDGDKIYAEMRDYLSGELTSLAPSESRMIFKRN